MTEKKYESLLKGVRNFSFLLLVLAFISIFPFLEGELNWVAIISLIFQAFLLLATIIGCSNRKIYGPICGVINAILMIISTFLNIGTLDTFEIILCVLDSLLGVVFLIVCIMLIKYMKK